MAFGQGPGGFTGLRVACGVAQGMALGLDIPLLPVVSHLAVAAQTGAAPGQAVLVALDARMNEVYLAVYRRAGTEDDEPASWETLQEPMLIAAAEVVPWAQHHQSGWRLGAPLLIAGDAWDAYAADMALPPVWRRVDALRPEAASVARLARQDWLCGQSVPAELAAPLYKRQGRLHHRRAHARRRPQGAPGHPGDAATADRRRSGRGGRAGSQCAVLPWTRGNFSDALAAGYGAWTLRQEGRLAGFCILMFAPDVAHLLVIAVARDLHRQGLGGELMHWCEQRARERGLEGVLLEVRPSNVSAIAFYKKHGYLQIGVRRGYYPADKGGREDALVMQKRFDANGA